MKRLSLLFFIILVFFVQAFGFTQSRKGYTLLAIPVFTETGLKEEANLLFLTMVDELEWLTKAHSFVRFATSRGMNGRPPPTRGKLNPADHALLPEYVITGVLNQEQDGTKVFEMSLWRLEDSTLMAVQELAYTDIEEGVGFIPFFILSLYSTLPGVIDFDEELKSWKNKWLYMGLRAGFSPRFYTVSGDYSRDGSKLRMPGFTFDAGLRGEIQIFPRLEQGKTFSFGLQTGVDFTYDSIDFTYYDRSTSLINRSKINTASVSVPLLAKFNIKPGQFVFGPYGGVYFTQPLSRYKITPPIGYTGGFNLGYKIGATGALFFDFRFSGDIGKTVISENDIPYNRYVFTLSMGFEWGFLTKKSKTEEGSESDTASGGEYEEASY
ncbi:MAG: hypothetical protein LBB98_04235 [Treponema sp.]|jgi:hypothetical protein|nr:hypothetical protein [Treponema sp.]